MTDVSGIRHRLAAFDHLLASAATGATASTTKPKPATDLQPSGPATLSAGTIAAVHAESAALAKEQKLDAYMASASGPYSMTLSSGGKANVAAPPQFRMKGGYNGSPDAARKSIVVALGPKVSEKLKHSIDRVVVGRGTADDVRKVTQALVDAGQLPTVSAEEAPEAIQAMQWRFGVGFDCAGYVQRAFFASRGMTGTPAERAKYGFAAEAVNFGSQSIQSNPKFKKVSPELARAGDLISLKPPPNDDVGHVVIVRSNTPLSALDKAKMKLPESKFPGKVQKLEVDSSWGAGELGKGGGVKTKTWLYDPSTQAWATYDPKTGTAKLSSEGGPYDHPLAGVYRPKGEP